jgi:hypothetical protein
MEAGNPLATKAIPALAGLLHLLEVHKPNANIPPLPHNFSGKKIK